MCGCSDGEPAVVYRAKLVTVRKPHECNECSRTIAAGELAERVTALWEVGGTWDLLYTCRKCRAIREAWHDVEGCWAPVGALRDEVFECLVELRRVPLAEAEEYHRPEAFERSAESAEFGMRLRAHLGKYGPQRPRAAL
jgi:hypothetical protein